MKKNIWHRITCMILIITMLFASINFVLAEGENANPEWYEKLFTYFIIANGFIFKGLISVILGSDLSIDALVFDKFPDTALTLFSADNEYYDEVNPLFYEGGVASGAVQGINDVFRVFQSIATIVYIVILVYMGIRIILVSTADKKARFKQFLVDWVKGVAILFLFPYVIRYTILLNHAIVTYIDASRNKDLFAENSPSVSRDMNDLNGAHAVDLPDAGSDEVADNTESGNYMDKMFWKAWQNGQLSYAICWFIMLIQLVQFWVVYMMRMIKVIFLIAIFPLVTISYAIDKIGDGKSQAFDHWFKEFVLEVFVQTFHAVNYVIIMGIVFKFADSNYFLAIIGVTYVSKGSDIIRSLFAQMRGGGAGGPMSPVASLAKAKMFTKGAKTLAGVGKRIATPISRGFGFIESGEQRLLNASVANSRNSLAEYARATGNSSTVAELIQQSPHVTVRRNEEEIQTLIEQLGAPNLSDADLRRISSMLANTQNLEANFEGALNRMGVPDAQKEVLRLRTESIANAGRAAMYLNDRKGGSNVEVQSIVDICMSNMTNPDFAKTMKAHGIDGKESLKNIAAEHSVGYSAEKRAERLAMEAGAASPTTDEEKIKYYTNAIKKASLGEYSYQELMGYAEYLEDMRDSGDDSARALLEEEMKDAAYSLEQFKANLAVQTINNSRDIESGDRQDAVDAAIRVIKDVQDDSNYKGILSNLETDINRLEEGAMPVVVHKDYTAEEKNSLIEAFRKKVEDKEVDLGTEYDEYNKNLIKEMKGKGIKDVVVGGIEVGFGALSAPYRAAGDVSAGFTALGSSSSGKGGFNPLNEAVTVIPEVVDQADSILGINSRIRAVGERFAPDNKASTLQIDQEADRKNQEYYENRALQDYVSGVIREKEAAKRFKLDELKKWEREKENRRN